MVDLAPETVAELVELAVVVVATGVLTVGGAIAEYAAVGNIATGHVGVGAWEVVVGALMLYAGVYLLGYERLAGRLLAARSTGE